MGRVKRSSEHEACRVLSDIVRTRRRDHGWRQLDLALALGVSVRQVKRWESGVQTPHPNTYARLVRVLGFTVVDTVRVRRAAAGLSRRRVAASEFTDLTG